MPFTPIHLGIAFPVKAISEKKFNLLIFAWAQVVMDLQPLIVLLTQKGETHGISHTFVAAGVLGAFTAVSGKYVLESLAKLFKIGKGDQVIISWKVAIISALFGTFSHVLLDALIYADMAPFWPFSESNPLNFGISSFQVIAFCLVSGVLGVVIWAGRVIIRGVKSRMNRIA